MHPRLIDSFASTDALSEVFSDAAVVRAMLRFETALAETQERLFLIPSAHAMIQVDPPDPATFAWYARQSASLAIPFVKALTARVREIDPQAAGFVHFGATSQDVLDTALVLMLRDARQILTGDHVRLESVLRTLSDRHAGTVMLARTVLQPAPPTTFGYKVAGWFGAIHRSWRGLSRAFDEALQLQFGGAAGTLAAYGDRGSELARELARELRLPLPEAPWHAHRDRLASLLAHCGVYTGSIAKIARDITLLMQPEIGEVSERGGGSSAMPNKRNPAGSVVALAAAARVPGLVAAFLAAMPHELERAAGGWQSEWPIVADVIQATGSALASVADTIAGLTVNPARMRANIEATHGAVFAEKAVMLLAPKLGREAAQSLVAEALKAKTLRQGLAHVLTPEQLETLASPEDYLGAAETFRRRLLEESA
ncbi:MAG TPA: lyase family protein [Bryobacteraceae bacterium]|nr:lyase family protein [Bryobacteraceae bacterium]